MDGCTDPHLARLHISRDIERLKLKLADIDVAEYEDALRRGKEPVAELSGWIIAEVGGDTFWAGDRFVDDPDDAIHFVRRADALAVILHCLGDDARFDPRLHSWLSEKSEAA